MKDYKGEIVEAKTKDGKPYKYLELELIPGVYKKKVFLDEAEFILLEKLDNKSTENSFNPFSN